MAKDTTNTKYIDQRFTDHNEWIKSIETEHKDTQKRVNELEKGFAGMIEAVKNLAESTDKLEQTTNKVLWTVIIGFLILIAGALYVGVIKQGVV